MATTVLLTPEYGGGEGAPPQPIAGTVGKSVQHVSDRNTYSLLCWTFWKQPAESSLTINIMTTSMSIIPAVLLCVTVVAIHSLLFPFLSETFSPALRRVPGPFASRFSRLWYLWHVSTGQFHHTNIHLHRKYGMPSRSNLRPAETRGSSERH